MEEGRKKVISGDRKKQKNILGKKAAEVQMIGLQATELYLQTEEAYFSAVFFISSLPSSSCGTFLLTWTSVFSQNASAPLHWK